MPKKAGPPSRRAPDPTANSIKSKNHSGTRQNRRKARSISEEQDGDASGTKKVFPVVAVGASAGGLEALSQLLAHLPSNTGMAYVLIQHLDPTHASQLPEILSRKTKMPIQELHGDTHVKADHVYVIAANDRLTIEKGIVHAIPRPTRGFGGNKSIDDFMESLAKDRGNQAFGVVLSGTASDGTIGLRAIKAEGGITFAQEPKSAKFDGMPRSAISAGAVDFVLPPDAIAKQLAKLASHPYLNPDPVKPLPGTPPAIDGDLGPIFSVLRSASGIDFTYYKHNTLRRRTERRMAMHGIEDLKEYSRKLRHEPAEAKALTQDFLINVTTFFREPETHAALRETVFPALIENRSADSPIRVWIPGCSTGEEAYSLAISLTEFLEDRDASCGIQIFATDVSVSVIEKARAGIYPENAVAGISPERLKRFFIKRDRSYQISQALRNACVFAKQDLTKGRAVFEDRFDQLL